MYRYMVTASRLARGHLRRQSTLCVIANFSLNSSITWHQLIQSRLHLNEVVNGPGSASLERRSRGNACYSMAHNLRVWRAQTLMSV